MSTETAAIIPWWVECAKADGSLDFDRSVRLWAAILRSVPVGEERMRFRDRKMDTVADGATQANKLVDVFDAYQVASLILTRAWTLAEADENAGDRKPTARHIARIMQGVMQAAEHPARPMPTSFPMLDRMLCGGPQPGELLYLGARPGVGKTAFALEVARSAAMAGFPVMFISREMMLTALGRRMIAQAGGIDARAIRLAEAGVWGDVCKTAGRLSQLPLWATDDARSVADIGWLCDSAPTPPDLVIVDYLQLLDSSSTGERRHQVEAVSGALKALAMRRKVPVICLSSLSRPMTYQDGKEKAPSLASLRESGQLEHDADVVIFLHRDRDETECQCIVAKNRDGETGIVDLIFSPATVRFAEASKRTEERNFYEAPHA